MPARIMHHHLQWDRVAALLAKLDQEHGPIDPRVEEEARRAWLAHAGTIEKRRTKA